MRELSGDKTNVAEILDFLGRFSSGDYRGQLPASDARGEMDLIRIAINELGRSLQSRDEAIKKKETRIQALLNILLRYTILDFSERAPVGTSADEIDALGAGLNVLGEEVIDHINKLKDSETQLQTIFENAPDAVVVIDSTDLIIRWNPVATRLFGWQEAEVKGKRISDILIPERFRERHQAGLRHFLKTGEGPVLNRTIELPALCKNSSEIEVELTISPARLKNDYLFISFMRDITDRKKAQEQIRQLNASLERRVLERTQQLNISETKYRHLFENNPMPLWVLDRESLEFLDVNESALKLYGYTREEFLSMTSLELRPDEEKARYLKLNRNTFGTQNTGVWRHRKKDGTIIYSEVSVHEMAFEGRPARLVLANDVTEKTKALQKLQYSEARFRRIFESKMIGFLFWDTDGTIVEANDLFLTMTGFSRKDLEEKKIRWDVIAPSEFTYRDKIALAQFRSTGVCEPFEKEYFRKDGSSMPLLLGAATIENDSLVKGVAVVMDISQRKKMERQIVELNRDLELRISQRTQALQLANKELESFTYSVSHDLRAPLRAIHGYSQMLTEDYEARLDKEGIRLLDLVKFNATRMGQLVDDLLAFSRIAKRNLSATVVDLTRLVNEVLQDFTTTENQRAKIKIMPLGTVMADGNLLRQAFHNLISNALKYSSKHPQPRIEIGQREIKGEITYYIKDNGAGFDMAYYKKLFGVFERLHEHEEFEGTGVGLAIVQRIIHRHGGRIWAESKVGEGAVFYFTLAQDQAMYYMTRQSEDPGLQTP